MEASPSIAENSMAFTQQTSSLMQCILQLYPLVVGPVIVRTVTFSACARRIVALLDVIRPVQVRRTCKIVESFSGAFDESLFSMAASARLVVTIGESSTVADTVRSGTATWTRRWRRLDFGCFDTGAFFTCAAGASASFGSVIPDESGGTRPVNQAPIGARDVRLCAMATPAGLVVSVSDSSAVADTP